MFQCFRQIYEQKSVLNCKHAFKSCKPTRQVGATSWEMNASVYRDLKWGYLGLWCFDFQCSFHLKFTLGFVLTEEVKTHCGSSSQPYLEFPLAPLIERLLIKSCMEKNPLQHQLTTCQSYIWALESIKVVFKTAWCTLLQNQSVFIAELVCFFYIF